MLLKPYEYSAEQLLPEHHKILSQWPGLINLRIEGAGDVLFCHATPRSETEIFTRLTSEERLSPVFENIRADIVICGHTHMQFDRSIGRVRVINAGSVGMPFGKPGAYWLLLGQNIEFRYTAYDLTGAADLILKTDYPHAKDFAENNVLHPPTEEAMLEIFNRAELE